MRSTPLASALMFVAAVVAAWWSVGGATPPRVTVADARGVPREALRLPDRVVALGTLTAGFVTYRRHCAGCHGEAGDGRGASGAGLSPPPRDFTRGAFKFAAVPAGALPRDEDLARTIRRGLAGTAMVGWSLGDRELDAVVQYLKTFSPRWRRESPPSAAEVITGPDPWRDHPAEAAREGERVYHREALCATCHPAYADPLPPRPEPRAPVAQYESVYSSWALAPDFRRHPLRAGRSVDDLHRAIAFGLGGTSMPTWQGALSDRALWALAYYVRSLTPAP